ncbi:PH domain-containing protein [Pedobacter nyackensis]|uniref:PH domain-containing protein n=1 Tax=Pedobacter nyackensis TaxID=475255 RepID=UPI00292FC793|nr:PH domain-containing protein [Pedobacter nyackensis]
MIDFTNDTIDIGNLPKYEEVPLNSVSKNYWKVVVINLIIFLFILAIGLTAVLYFSVAFRPYIYVVIAGFIALGLILFMLYKTDISRRGYAVREKDILYRSGIISISTTIIPFSRIQHIALDEGLFSRIYHLGQLRIFTAGGSSGSLHIPGIDIQEARQIKEILMKQINAAE